MSITLSQRRAVIQRAADCCEYCQLASISSTVPFHVDHIIPIKHGGADEIDNLSLACYRCNAHKGHDLTGFDPLTGEIARLYHPRLQRWAEHFVLQDNMRIEGLTPEGRATVQVLRINDEKRVESRRLLFEIGEYPCRVD